MNLTVAPGGVPQVLHVLVFSSVVAGWSRSLRVDIVETGEVGLASWSVVVLAFGFAAQSRWDMGSGALKGDLAPLGIELMTIATRVLGKSAGSSNMSFVLTQC